MKITAANLRTILGFATKVIEKRNTIPVLSTVRLVAEGAQLTASGTNLDIQIDAWAPLVEALPTFGEDPFATCIQCDALYHMLNLMDGETIVELLMENGKPVFLAPGIRVDEFPHVGKLTDWPEVSILGDPIEWRQDPSFVGTMMSLRPFISTEETQYYLNGVCLLWDPEAKCSAIVATDGHRLMSRRIEVPEEVAVQRAIVPSAAVPRWADVAQNRSVIVTAYSTRNHNRVTGAKEGDPFITRIRVEAPNCRMTTKMIEGTYPETWRVIPRGEGLKRATIERDVLAKSVDCVQEFTPQRSAAVRFQGKDGVVQLSTDNPDAPKVCVEAGSWSGEEHRVGFCRRYLKDALDAIRSPTVEIEFSDASNPHVLRAPGAHPSDLVVLMPLRL